VEKIKNKKIKMLIAEQSSRLEKKISTDLESIEF
jgi:hypothetical protein